MPPVQPVSIPDDFATQIRELRTRLGLTQVRLAELLGVSFVSINRWENGQARPSALAWRRLGQFAEQRGTVLGAVVAEPSAAFRVAEQPADLQAEGAPERSPDFSTLPDVVLAVAEAERLSFGHLFNPAFASELSLVDPLPHQRIAVYEHMLAQPRLRFLLADDAGAGKTIMSGLYIREMLTRRLIRRVLVVSPAGLIGNWQNELERLFSLRFRILLGAEARASNPFVGPESDLVIVSVDTLAADRMFERLQAPEVAPYDLVIFDEAHKLSADRNADFTVRRTDRYRLAEALAGASDGRDERWSLGWSAHHLLLLTATPHQGKDLPYFFLWRLLLPDVLSTFDAFSNFPQGARARHFLRRTKEEMVRFDGSRLYPDRISDTLSYELSQGPDGEQALYVATTAYIRTFYNRARILNRSAARLAMSVFQRRLASSTWALLRSFERRLERLDGLIEDVRIGRLSEEQLIASQRQLDRHAHDPLDDETGDEESPEHGREANEIAADRAMGGVVATSLAELIAERNQVSGLLALAQRVAAAGHESKFDKLREVLRNPKFRDEKILIFTEHRDTLDFLVRRLEGLGFTGQVARIHGGMDFSERREQVEFFRRTSNDGGATYMVCTDAAAEGINLQFCWLMVNYDIPWNPARLEQRMGRIHRYKQLHDPVIITNLIAGTTREGRVLQTLLLKLERIRRELGSDKVFDVIGRVFEGTSLREYMERTLEEDTAELSSEFDGRLTSDQVRALAERERVLYGDGGDVKSRLETERAKLEREELRRLLPGYVRRLLVRGAPLLDLRIDGELDDEFAFGADRPFALAPLWPAFESYATEAHQRLTITRPSDERPVVFMRPGEPVFDAFCRLLRQRYAAVARRGAVFVDPYAETPYMYSLAHVSVVRRTDPDIRAFNSDEVLESRLVGLRVAPDGAITETPVERLLLLRGATGGIPFDAAAFAADAGRLRDRAHDYVAHTATAEMVARRRDQLLATMSGREDFLRRGYAYQDAELAARRSKLSEKARAGDARAKGELTRIKERQRAVGAERDAAVAVLHREPELITAGSIQWITHALVVPSDDPEERRRHDADVEAIAMRIATAYEEARQSRVRDVSAPQLARAAGLGEHPGFDLLTERPGERRRAIEVKGRGEVGAVELTENEWATACTQGDDYWLYVVFDCATPAPRLVRVRNPFQKLLVSRRESVIIQPGELFADAHADD